MAAVVYSTGAVSIVPSVPFSWLELRARKRDRQAGAKRAKISIYKIFDPIAYQVGWLNLHVLHGFICRIVRTAFHLDHVQVLLDRGAVDYLKGAVLSHHRYGGTLVVQLCVS